MRGARSRSKGKGGSAPKRASKAAAKGGGASSSKKKSAEKVEKDEQKRSKWTKCQVQKLVELIVEHVPAGNMGWQAVSDSFNEIGANENWRERDVDSERLPQVQVAKVEDSRASQRQTYGLCPDA